MCSELTCVFPLDVGGAGAADGEAREGKALVTVHIQKVTRHRELQSIWTNHSSSHKDSQFWRARTRGIYRVVHLDSWVHEPENVFTVARLQADDVINDIIHLQSTNLQVSFAFPGNLTSTTESLTSFSQLELRVSRALGLLGALLPGPGGMPCSGGWLGHWLTGLPPRLVDRYCLTCCLWACWMWYLDGFSRWGCTYRSRRQHYIIDAGTKPLQSITTFKF